jgi:hypothetical protein
VFGEKGTGACLLKLSWTPIRRHVLVKGAASPDDPALRSYWTRRERRKLEEGLLRPRLNTIIRVERNQVEPHFRTIRKLAEALGIDPKALL